MTISSYEKEEYRIEEVVERIKEVINELGHQGFSLSAIFCALHITEFVFENKIKEFIQNIPEDKRPEFLKIPDEYIDSIRRFTKSKFIYVK
jgi:hypothetical protein